VHKAGAGTLGHCDADRPQESGRRLPLGTRTASDPKRGRKAFAKNCTACPWIGELSVNVAPNIGDSRTMTPPQILVDILDPNRKVDNNFFSCTATTKDGRLDTGIRATETARSVMLRE
jgi:putative heme-binding domain-containing protein